MDAFFAQVEMLHDKTLLGVPMAVGGMKMLATSNYEARKFGVRPAMPGFIAKELCPQLVIVPPNFAKYESASHAIHSILIKYDPDMTPSGLDEAYLNLSHHITSEDDLNEKTLEIVTKIKREILEVTNLTCTIGVGHSRQMAKICSNVNKPDGYYIQLQNSNDEVTCRDFMFKQPVGRISGVGHVTENLLKSIGVLTCKDIYELRHKVLYSFGLNRSLWLFSCSLGVDEPCREVKSKLKAKQHTIGVERTFQPTSDINILYNTLEFLSAKVCESLRENNLETNKVTLKIKFDNFEVITRCNTSENVFDSSENIFGIAKELLSNEIDGKKVVRLLGIRVNKIKRIEENRKLGQKVTRTIDEYFSKRPVAKDQSDYVSCPICSNSIENNVRKINRHIDECLNHEYIKDLST
ncbi:DNA polymerase kappa [Thelohanellus kitauei]|uniref:DNA polymerase kappa n=1 Tax=Thelohanellus kitauei TaxID=669202 RepID=A0A0C2J7T8_THEKT|nr:DNA polymerase kappa [Thelohanellus kitauei]